MPATLNPLTVVVAAVLMASRPLALACTLLVVRSVAPVNCNFGSV